MTTAIDDGNFSTGSSLVLVAYDRAAGVSAVYDLGLNYSALSVGNNSFSPATPASATWNLNSGNYASVLARFNTLSTNPDNVRWGVFAVDSVGADAGSRGIIQTFNSQNGPTPTTITSSALLTQIGTVNEYLRDAKFVGNLLISTADASVSIASGTANFINLMNNDSVNNQGGLAVASYGQSMGIYERLTTDANLKQSTVAFLGSSDAARSSFSLTRDGTLTFNSTGLTPDTISPNIAISTSDNSLTVGETAAISFTLSETSTNFTIDDITVTGGTISNFAGSGRAYSASFTPTTNSSSNGVVSVASNKFTDAAGVNNADGSDANNTVTMTVDQIVPTIAVSSNDKSLTFGETATISFTLSEASTDFAIADITVTGGALSNFAGSGRNYSATFTPTANSSNNGEVSVASSKFTDAAGNSNTASNTETMTVNTLLTNIVTKAAVGNLPSSSSAGNSTQTGNGNDIIVIADPKTLGAKDLVNGQIGSDEIRFTSATAKQTLTLGAGVTNIEKLTIGTGSAFTAVTTATTALNVNAAAVLTGMTITGNNGDNSITGTKGNDIIDGGLGIDKMNGGLGNDTFYVDNDKDTVTEAANAGTDSVISSVSFTLGNNVENLTFNGNSGTLTGNALNNTIIGHTGNDIIKGGAGADTLTGGSGKDTFVFKSGDTGYSKTVFILDKITDYTKGAVGTGDVIDFDKILTVGGATTTATDTQASINATTGVATFAAGSGTTLLDAVTDIATSMTTAKDAAGEFAIFKIANTGDFYLFISDGSKGVGAKDVIIELTGVNTLSGINLTDGNLTII